jgi:hypothetical protein
MPRLRHDAAGVLKFSLELLNADFPGDTLVSYSSTNKDQCAGYCFGNANCAMFIHVAASNTCSLKSIIRFTTLVASTGVNAYLPGACCVDEKICGGEQYSVMRNSPRQNRKRSDCCRG